MTRFLALSLLLGTSLVASVANAQTPAPAPGPAQPATDPNLKADAKALLASGLKLYAGKDYLGALAVFKDAYQRFASPKILLNIGTTLKALNRNAEAANVYQRYLDAPDAEESKKGDVSKVLADLDTKLGVLEITVTPDDAELQIGTGDWVSAKEAAHYRVEPSSSVVVHARKEGYESADISIVTVAAGSHKTMTLLLKPVVVATVPTPSGGVDTTATTGTGIKTSVTPEQPPGKLGFFAYEHVDIQFKGAATFVGAAYEVIPNLQAEVAAVVGPKPGGYAGARYSFLPGKLHPLVAVGVPMFVSSGARFGLRGAAGIEIVVHRHISIVAEAGLEHVFNPQMNFAATTFIPALGVIGRL